MLFPEDGCLPKITRSGLAPFNNVMIVKVPEQFRKPGETIFQLATLDPSKKTERWPADKFIYKSSVIEDLAVPDCIDTDSNKKKPPKKPIFEIPKFEIGGQKSLFTLEKQRSKSVIKNFPNAMSSEHGKRVSPNVKKYENNKDFKYKSARNHQYVRNHFAAKTPPDNRGFRNREYDEMNNHYNNRVRNIDPWIAPPTEYINSTRPINPEYKESLKMPVNELKNNTADLSRQESKVSHFYDDGDERLFGHIEKNLPDVSQSDYMVYQEQLPRNTNWEPPSAKKRGLLRTPLKNAPPMFDVHSHPEEPNFRIPPRMDESFGFNNSCYNDLPDFSYRNQYTNILGAESKFDRNYLRSNRDEPNFNRNHHIDPNLEAIPFSNNLSEIDSFRNDFHRAYTAPENVLKYQDRRYEQNPGRGRFFRNPDGNGRGRGFKPRNQNSWRGGRRNVSRGSHGNRYIRGQQNERFQKKTAIG